MRIIIIGAGAAGCFAAINIKRNQPDAVVTVLESGRKPLAKVAVTGGGRCNLTNSFADVKSLDKVYPRGGRLMKRLLREFSHEDTCAWFEREGVRLVTQEDQCVFPKSQDAMEIVNTLMRLHCAVECQSIHIGVPHLSGAVFCRRGARCGCRHRRFQSSGSLDYGLCSGKKPIIVMI